MSRVLWRYCWHNSKNTAAKGDLPMSEKRLSHCQGKGSLTHNNRKFNAKNVDDTRTKNNIVFMQQPIEEAYERLFGAAVERYNAKQKRADRKIKTGYFRHIFKRDISQSVVTAADKRKSFYEDVVQIGDMKNTGWELTVNYNSPQYGDWSWNGNFNISQYKNKVEKLNDFTKTLGGDVRLIEGKPMGVYYGYVVDGIFQNETEVANHATQQGKGVGRFKYRDLDGNGVINENDQCVIGDPNPDFSLGLNLSVTWKRLTLSTFLTGEFGFDIYNGTKRQLDFMSYGGNSTNRGKDILNAWSPTNTSSSIPALTLADNNNETRMSTYFVEDGSYLKMKFVKLAYDLPTKWLSRIGASALSVYGQLENVFTITGYSGLDPELPLGTYGARYDGGPYPRSRTFTVGVNLTF